ncbi:cell division protein FtsK, partial [Micromonospora sp. SL1-18]
FDRHTVLPVLKTVRCGAGVDVVTVRMVTGQIPDDFGRVAERLAHTFGVRQVKATPSNRPDVVLLHLFRGDPLAKLVRP